jgi:hypothetical protein
MEYESILTAILDAFGLDRHSVLHSNRQDCVDARSALVHILVGMGYTERGVSRLTGFSQQRVNHLKNGFRYRRGYELTMNLQTVYKRIFGKDGASCDICPTVNIGRD